MGLVSEGLTDKGTSEKSEGRAAAGAGFTVNRVLGLQLYILKPEID